MPQYKHNILSTSNVPMLEVNWNVDWIAIKNLLLLNYELDILLILINEILRLRML